MVERLHAAYRVMQWRNKNEPITRKDAFDYVAALRVGVAGRLVAPGLPLLLGPGFAPCLHAVCLLQLRDSRCDLTLSTVV